MASGRARVVQRVWVLQIQRVEMRVQARHWFGCIAGSGTRRDRARSGLKHAAAATHPRVVHSGEAGLRVARQRLECLLHRLAAAAAHLLLALLAVERAPRLPRLSGSLALAHECDVKLLQQSEPALLHQGETLGTLARHTLGFGQERTHHLLGRLQLQQRTAPEPADRGLQHARAEQVQL